MENCNSEMLNRAMRNAGIRNGFEEITAEFAAFRDFKLKWTRSYKWICFEVSDYLMEHARIMVNQGTPYGSQGEGHIRIVTACFAKDEDAVERFERIKAALTQMAKEKGII